MYSVKIEDWVYGKIDGGGPEMLMKNMNGNIISEGEIKNSKR